MTSATAPAPGVPSRSPVLAGTLTQVQKDFSSVFGAFMTNGVKDKLFAFIDRQGAAELLDCAAAYFTLDALPLPKMRERSRTIFLRLAERIASKSPEAALILGVLVKGPAQPWSLRYRDLAKDGKGALDKAINRQKAKIPGTQRAFVDAFLNYVAKGSQADLEKVAASLSRTAQPAHLQACVRLYLELSEALEEVAGLRSLDVFYMVSDAALRTGRSTFALEYDARRNDPGSLLHRRFEEMGRTGNQGADRKKALNRRITDAITKDAPPPGSRPGETRLPPPTEKQAEFVKRYRAYVDGGTEKQMIAFQNALIKPAGDEIADYVARLLQDSAARYPGPPSHRLSQIFFGTLASAIAKSSSFYAAKVKSYIEAKDGLWRLHFDALNATASDKLQYGEPLRRQIDDKIKNKRLLDDLRIAFWLKFNRDPTLAELRSFDAVDPHPDFEKVDSALGAIDVAVGVRNLANSLEALDKAYSELGAALEAAVEPKARWMLVKRILERPSPTIRFRHLAYLQGVGLIYVACVKTYNTLYWNGFDEAERTFFFALSGASANPYYADFAARVDGVIAHRGERDTTTRPPAGAEQERNEDFYTLMAKADASLLVCADKMNLRLTPMLAAAVLRGGVEEAWDKAHRDATAAMRIPIDARRAGRVQLPVGAKFGNIAILWWDRANYTAYIQIDRYRQIVFEADQAWLGRAYEDYQIWGKVAEYTEGMGLAIPIVFQILGYLPDLVSGGLTGLIKSVIFNLEFDISMEAMGIDPRKAQLVLLGAALLHAGMAPKAEEPHMGSVPEPAVPPEPGPIKGQFYDQDIGFVPVAEKQPTQFYGLTSQEAHPVPGVIESGSGLSSNQGYDARGIHLDDGRVGVGLHEGDVGDAATSSSTPFAERETGPGATAKENPGTAAPITDQNRGIPQREVPRQQAVQQQQSKVLGPDQDKVGRSTVPEKTADKDTLKAERRESIKSQAGQRRIDAARQGTSGESYLTGRPIPTDTGPAQMTILGDRKAFDASRRNGYQVYIWRDAEGRVIYPGSSGRTLERGSGKTPLADWETRLMNDHADSLWIQNAASVEVVSGLTFEQFTLLEQDLIAENLGANYNFNERPNPDAARIAREGTGEFVIPTNATRHRFGVVIVHR